MTLDTVTVAGHPTVGVRVRGASTWQIRNSHLSGGPVWTFPPALALHGDALVANRGVQAWDGVSGLLLQDTLFAGAEGVGVFLDGSSATLDGLQFTDNALDVLQQRCDSAPSTPPDGPLDGDWSVSVCPESGDRMVLDADLSFFVDLGGVLSE